MSSGRGSKRCHHRVILQQIGLHSAGWEERYETRYSCSLPRGECTEPRIRAECTAAAAIILNYHRLSGTSRPRRDARFRENPVRPFFRAVRLAASRFSPPPRRRDRSFVPSGDELTTERAERKARNRVERGDDGGTGTDAPTPPRCTNDKILISRRVYNNAHYSRNASGYPKRGLSAPWTDCSMEREVGGLGPVISGP